jgi:parvulin-like peptidyl-prolyl isomerase
MFLAPLALATLLAQLPAPAQPRPVARFRGETLFASPADEEQACATLMEKLAESEARARGLFVSAARVEALRLNVLRHNQWDEPHYDAYLAATKRTRQWHRQFLEKFDLELQLAEALVGPEVDVPTQDIDAWVERAIEVRLRHIVILVAPDAAPHVVMAAYEKARQAEDQAKRPGADFAALSGALSEGESRSSGGELGFVRRGDLHSAVDEAAFALLNGEVSKPVRSTLGFHVLKREGSRPAAAKEVLRDQAWEQLSEEARVRRVTAFQKLLAANAVTEGRLELFSDEVASCLSVEHLKSADAADADAGLTQVRAPSAVLAPPSEEREAVASPQVDERASSLEDGGHRLIAQLGPSSTVLAKATPGRVATAAAPQRAQEVGAIPVVGLGAALISCWYAWRRRRADRG